MMWVKCTTYLECKSFRIAESSVMDDWEDFYRAVLVLISKRILEKQCLWNCFYHGMVRKEEKKFVHGITGRKKQMGDLILVIF